MQDPLQEQLIAARRKQILDAATEVFAEQGYHQATIRAVARRANIADGTIYNYFENKTALLIAILDRLNETEQRSAAFDAGAAGDFEQFFEMYLRHRLQVLIDNLQVFRALLPEVLANPALGELYYRQLITPTMAIGEGFFNSLAAVGAVRDLDGALLIRTLAASSLGLLVLRLLGDPVLEERWDDIPATLAKLFLEGIKK